MANTEAGSSATAAEFGKRVISADEYREHILGQVRPLPPRVLPLGEALGRVCAQDVAATLSVPPFTNSAMDGYVVLAADIAGASEDAPVVLEVIGDQPAGVIGAPEVRPGAAVRIMTGALLPGADTEAGADLTIVPVEYTDQPVVPGAPLPERVEVRASFEARQNVRVAGDDVTPGDVIVRAGTVLGPRDLAALASVGHGEVLAHPPVRVGILATGDELVDPGQPISGAQIPDSNSTLVAALVRVAGATPVMIPRSSDDADALRATIEDSVRGGKIDALITTGGVSAGAYDVVKEVLAPLGEVVFGKITMQPGKPQGFGLLDGRVPTICLPGNPVSVFVSFQMFAAPTIAKLEARFDEARAPETFEAIAADSWRSHDGREQYVPVVLDAAASTDGTVAIRRATAGGSASHLIGTLGLAQALAVVPAEVTQVREGDRLRVMMTP